MSERGSYCTEFIYCRKCAEAVKVALAPDSGGYHEAPVDVDRGYIFAGRLGGMYRGQEIEEFKARVLPKLDGMLCHKLRIALLAEVGQEFVTVEANEMRAAA